MDMTNREFVENMLVFGRDHEVGRPVRKTRICKDDQLNLKIALETSRSLEEFLELV